MKRKIKWNRVEWFIAQLVFCAFCIPTALSSFNAVMRENEAALYETNPVKWLVFSVTIIWWMIVTPCGPVEYIRTELNK